jgi:hypothetical protein
MADLTSIPNVGPRIAADFRRLGINNPDDLRGHDGDQLYEQLCADDGTHHDICLRDTFVAAIAYIETGDDAPGGCTAANASRQQHKSVPRETPGRRVSQTRVDRRRSPAHAVPADARSVPLHQPSRSGTVASAEHSTTHRSPRVAPSSRSLVPPFQIQPPGDIDPAAPAPREASRRRPPGAPDPVKDPVGVRPAHRSTVETQNPADPVRSGGRRGRRSAQHRSRATVPHETLVAPLTAPRST